MEIEGPLNNPYMEIARELDELAHKVELQGININNDIANIKDDVDELEKRERNYITRERYAPVERLVYGFVGLVLIAVIMAIIGLIVRTPGA